MVTVPIGGVACGCSRRDEMSEVQAMQVRARDVAEADGLLKCERQIWRRPQERSNK